MQSQIKKHVSCRTGRSYEQPTIASKSRSPSPYTKRRMCELSEDSKQRLAHLKLGPYEFKKESDHKPPFVVRHAEALSTSLDTTLTSCHSKESPRAGAESRLLSDASLLGSYRPLDVTTPRKQHVDAIEGLDSINDHLLFEPAGRLFHSDGLSLSYSAPSSLQKHPASPVLHRSSLRERFHSPQTSSANWEEIHTRVKNMLRTHRARQRLQFDKSVTALEERHNRKGLFSNSLPELHGSPILSQEKTVHLDNGEYWSRRAAEYKGKSHRVVFEESMEKIYRNMYRNATDPHAYRKSLNS